MKRRRGATAAEVRQPWLLLFKLFFEPDQQAGRNSVRTGFAVFPAVDRRKGHADKVGEIFLCKLHALPNLANALCVHTHLIQEVLPRVRVQ